MNKIVTDQKELRVVSRETSWDEVHDLHLKDKIIEALPTAWTNGCGLASVQIGFPLRYAYLRIKDTEIELINPVVPLMTGWVVYSNEGCLSIPNTWSTVERYNNITIDTEGEGDTIIRAVGFLAQVFQHEIDHMNGILNIDRKPKVVKVGRNDLCPCGSGMKYKKCCSQ